MLLPHGRVALTDAERATLAARMKEHLATDRLEFLIGLGADPVARELSKEPR